MPYDVKSMRTPHARWNMHTMTGVSTNWQRNLKRPKKEINLFAKRAMNYKNLFDKESKLMRGRNEDGTFQSPFSPLKWGRRLYGRK